MKDIKHCDKLLLILMVVYSLFGLLMVASSSSASSVLRYNVSLNHFFMRQLLAVSISFFVGFIIMLIPIRKLKVPAYILYFVFLGLLIYVPIIGKVAGNAQSWIRIAGFQVQPSEFIKSITIICMGFFYNFLDSVKHNKLKFYFASLVPSVFSFILIVIQPDYGSAIIFALIVMCIFFSLTYVKENRNTVNKLLFIGLIIGSVVVFAKWDSIFTPKRMDRVTNFLKPCTRYQEQSGYQVCNGHIAIANGGLFGLGLGKSTQKHMYLPDSHTDFIFPIICEELGAITGIIVIIGYAIILYRVYLIFRKSKDTIGRVITLGTFVYLSLHILINLLGILSLMPLTGVPLPFLSYGGSYVINVIVMLFFCERVAIENKKREIKAKIASL